MLPNAKKFSAHKRIRWDKHCLLVIQFPISLQAEIRRSARFAEVTRGLRQSLALFAPQRALEFLVQPSTLAASLGFGPSKKGSEQHGTSSPNYPVIPV